MDEFNVFNAEEIVGVNILLIVALGLIFARFMYFLFESIRSIISFWLYLVLVFCCS